MLGHNLEEWHVSWRTLAAAHSWHELAASTRHRRPASTRNGPAEEPPRRRRRVATRVCQTCIEIMRPAMLTRHWVPTHPSQPGNTACIACQASQLPPTCQHPPRVEELRWGEAGAAPAVGSTEHAILQGRGGARRWVAAQQAGCREAGRLLENTRAGGKQSRQKATAGLEQLPAGRPCRRTSGPAWNGLDSAGQQGGAEMQQPAPGRPQNPTAQCKHQQRGASCKAKRVAYRPRRRGGQAEGPPANEPPSLRPQTPQKEEKRRDLPARS